MGVEPEDETVTLYEQIQAGELKPPKSVSEQEPTIVLQVPGFLQAEVEDIERPTFVARERELARLGAFLDKSLAGNGQVAFILGGPGRGKTALLNAFAQRAMGHHPDLLVASGNCNAYSGVGDPYLPFRELMLMLTGEVEDRWATGSITLDHARRLWSATPETILTLLDRGPEVIPALMPGIGLLSRAAAAAPAGAPWLVRLREQIEEQQKERQRLEQSQLFEQITEVVRRLADQHPLVLMMDNLQWADTGSIGLLFHLGRRLENTPILIACAYRPEEVALGRDGDRHPLEKVLNEFKLQYGDVQVDLGQVDEEEGLGFVNAIIETEPNHLGDAFRRTLYQHTQGHPLFTIELLRAMQARGDLKREDNGCWVEGEKLDWERLPARVEGAIEERIGRLKADLRELLAVASVEGEDFTVQVVAQVQEIEERRLLRTLSLELEKQHLLVREQGGLRVGLRNLSRYQFAHALFQRYLYNHISQGERRLLHKEVAEVLEGLYEGNIEAIAVQLAHHYDMAANPERALGYYLQAGDAAAKVFAHIEARIHFSRAMDILAQFPDALENRRQYVDTIIKLTNSTWRSDLPEENLARLSEAEQMTRGLLSAAEISAADRLRLARIHFWMGRIFYIQGMSREAIGYYQQVLPVAQESGDAELIALPSSAIGYVMWLQGRLGQAEILFSQAVTALKEMHNLYEWTRARAAYGIVLAGMGAYEAGKSELLSALDWIRQSGSLKDISSIPFSMGIVYLIGGNLSHAIKEASIEAVESLGSAGEPIYKYLGHGVRSWAECRMGQFEAAKASMMKSQAIARELGGEVMVADWFAAVNAEIAFGEGHIEEALILAKQAVDTARKMGGLLGEGLAQRVWGQALAAQIPPNWNEAESQLAESLSILMSGQNLLEAARTHVAWGTVCCDRGDFTAAREHWEQAAAQFEKSDLPHELKPVQKLIASLPMEKE